MDAAKSALDSAKGRLYAALAEQTAAEQSLRQAEAALAAAQRELGDASCDLAHCQACLNWAAQAKTAARNAVVRAELAASAAQDGVECSTAARESADQIAQRIAKEHEWLEVLALLGAQAHHFALQADQQLRHAEPHADAVEDTTTLCVRNLSLRVDDLTAINAPKAFS